MFSQTVEYALRAVVWLAQRSESPQTNREIADGMRVPPDYLAKVLQTLVRAELVTAQRGKNGGFALARPAVDTTLLEVVNAVDPIRRIRKCPLGLAAHCDNLCSLHRKLDDAFALVEQSFATTTLADVLQAPSPVSAVEALVEIAHAG